MGSQVPRKATRGPVWVGFKTTRRCSPSATIVASIARPGGGKVDGTSAQQPPRLREHRLTKGADKILLGESGAANPRLRLLLRSSGGPAHDWKIPLSQ